MASADVDLTATAIAAGGDAIARDGDGRVVFLAGALPGERVRVAITERRRDYSHGRVVKILEPSPFRVVAPCPALGLGCGGCQWQHVTPEGQRELKHAMVLDALRRIAKLPDPTVEQVVDLPGTGYRTTLRAMVTDGVAGYRRGGTHDQVTVDDCLVAHPLVADLLLHGRYPGAREVVLRCGARTGERLVHPRPSGAPVEVPGDVRRDHLHEEVDGRRWRISGPSFFQPSPEGAEALVRLVRDAAGLAPDGGRAIDLYSGIGLFAGTLATLGWQVTAVEGQAAAVADAEVNLAEDGVTVSRCDVRRWKPQPAELVVADPSRAGLGAEGVAVVAGCAPAEVVLVSCDPAAMARDVRLLAGHGYRHVSSSPVDLFPHTFHVEVVTLLER